MTSKREAFPTLEDIDNGNAGTTLSQAVEGDVVTGRNFAGILTGKRTTDNTLQFPALNANNEFVVDLQGSAAFACLKGKGTVANGSASETLVAKITLQATTDYEDLEFLLSCTRTTIWRIVSVDDAAGTPVETDLVEGLVSGSGQFTLTARDIECIGKFTSAATGVQELQVLAYNLNATSDIFAAIGIKEKQ